MWVCLTPDDACSGKQVNRRRDDAVISEAASLVTQTRRLLRSLNLYTEESHSVRIRRQDKKRPLSIHQGCIRIQFGKGLDAFARMTSFGMRCADACPVSLK